MTLSLSLCLSVFLSLSLSLSLCLSLSLSLCLSVSVVLGMSASWDNTLRLWDIDAGKALGIMREPNKARGFALYKDNSRAVCTGSGLCLSIWN
eukprot:COSAG03_NODE_2181_length_3039_cov_3.187075_1_plen_92_part_10